MMVSGRGALGTAAVLCALALAMPAAAQSDEAATVGARPRAVAPAGIFNFGQVDASYYRGGELDGQDGADLAALGVKTVIDLRSDEDYSPAEAQLASTAGLKYVRIPMTTRTEPTSDQIKKFLSVVTDPANQPVYVHCVEGRHRTGVMTAVYRMSVDGWTADRAFDEMKRYKFGMDFLHPEFKHFVYAYHPAPIEVPTATTIVAGTN